MDSFEALVCFLVSLREKWGIGGGRVSGCKDFRGWDGVIFNKSEGDDFKGQQKVTQGL